MTRLMESFSKKIGMLISRINITNPMTTRATFFTDKVIIKFNVVSAIVRAC